MDTLALTLVAVAVSLAIGIPLGVWAGLSRAVRRRSSRRSWTSCRSCRRTPISLPLALVFLIGPATAVIATVIYATPPVIRLTAHGIREVPANTVEAADSLGSTARQKLFKVLMPMARRTIVLGINQTIMAALAMVTIAALIAAPGLGQSVLQALISLDVGTAAQRRPGHRDHGDHPRPGHHGGVGAGGRPRRAAAASKVLKYRRPAVIGGAVVTAVLLYLSYTYLWAAQFPGATDADPPGGQGDQRLRQRA